MKALLVVDIDHGDGWSPEEVSDNESKKKIKRALIKQIANTRAMGDIVMFVVLANTQVTGQEAQIHYSALPERKKRWRLLRRDRGEYKGCIVCKGSYCLAAFLEHRHGEHGEAAFIKQTSDAFTNKEISEYLRTQDVTELVLGGCNTFVCILGSAIGALKNGFNVTLLGACTYPRFTDKKDQEEWLQKARSGASLSSRPGVSVRIQN